ncbi:MAG TPA: hypothetical protein VD969_27300 [Symbiobacteriaceae bacterium]|nr:hypothetical protein [Symbiobacteriaceae bacterium]
MQPEIEQSLYIEFEELFALGDRIRQVADSARARLLAAGLTEALETEVMDGEAEFRGTTHERLLIRLDGSGLEISGAPTELQTHVAAAILLDEAGAFRLTSVEMGLTMAVRLGPGRRLDMVARAFPQLHLQSADPVLDRRFSVTWDWGNATTGFSFHVADTEDRELFLSFKAREGYMDVPELQNGRWIAAQAQRFDGLTGHLFRQLGWNM